MPDTILIFGINPRKKTTCATLLHVNITVYGFSVLKSATAFYRLPKLTLMFAKLKKCPLPTSELLLSRGIKNKKGLFLLCQKCVFICLLYFLN